MRLRRLPPILAILIAAFAVPGTSCSSGDDPNAAPSPSPSPSPSANIGTLDPRQSRNPLEGGGSPSPQATEDGRPPGAGPCEPTVVFSQNAGVPGANYIQIQPGFQNGWGPNCSPLNAGDACEVKISGAYQVIDKEAYVEFQAWIPGRDEPYVKREIGPLADQGSFRRWAFPVAVPKAEEIAFRMVLRGSSKAPVAVSDTFIYKIDCTARKPSPTPS